MVSGERLPKLYQTVAIGNEPQTISLSLRRIVSLCRFVINDAVPEGIAKLEFYYTGGSGHFDATTGKGVTNSQQKVTVPVASRNFSTSVNIETAWGGELRLTY